MHRVLCAPLRYVQGDGVTGRLALEMAVLGIHGPVLVVAGRSAAEARALDARAIVGAGGSKCLAAAHAVHNGLTILSATHAAPHGEKVAFGTLVQMVLDGTPADEFAAVVRFCRAVGVPMTLAQLGRAKPAHVDRTGAPRQSRRTDGDA